ncbi:hypothetical protein PENSTE_c006G01808 [Penicillium steckii]|uniref:Histone-lysine N-methyltransferase n=1 Tax=Penicillium steckii TaxID=303698 RepID=A0A1V6TGF0_9EURO|nr:hypothetical protein PENSTE_c006G01808 [Penicillium steckii]
MSTPFINFIDLTEDVEVENETPAPQTNGFINVKSLTPPIENPEKNENSEKSENSENIQPENGTFSTNLVVSPSLPIKRKSSEYEQPRASPVLPRTPTPKSVSVVVPTPSLSLDQYLKVEPELTGLSETFYPTKSVQQAEVSMRRYPRQRTSKRSFVPLSANLGDRPRPEPSNEDLETIQRASLTRGLARLEASGTDIRFNIDKENLFLLAASNFGFIQDYILREGVERVPEEFNAGCECPGGVCDPTRCNCLMEEEHTDEKIVPYQLNKRALQPDFLGRTSMIYECNHRCSCQARCWFNVTQRGRNFQPEIFHTGNRGFGLRSFDNIQVGEFIDYYLGEVLTQEEANYREDDQQVSYLFSLDFIPEQDSATQKDYYVVDGRKFGNVTRFMNHSCNPNCKIKPVSIDHADDHIYYLAFFALRDIPAGEELTFDYNPGFNKKEKKAAGAVKCLCGDAKCRGQLWPNARKQQNRSPADDSA